MDESRVFFVKPQLFRGAHGQVDDALAAPAPFRSSYKVFRIASITAPASPRATEPKARKPQTAKMGLKLIAHFNKTRYFSNAYLFPRRQYAVPVGTVNRREENRNHSTHDAHGIS
ncbi:MAG: hypothetical protein HY579_08070 [Nitrospinae bacterium]|nr:hypothetical protein [Nitrospinota bacterium]